MFHHFLTCWITTKPSLLIAEYFFQRRGGWRRRSATSRQRCSMKGGSPHMPALSDRCSLERQPLKARDFGSPQSSMKEIRTRQVKKWTRSNVSSPVSSVLLRNGLTAGG